MKQYKHKKSKEIYSLIRVVESGFVYYHLEHEEKIWIYGAKAFKENFVEIVEIEKD